MCTTQWLTLLRGLPLNACCLVSLQYLAFFKPSIPRSSSVAIFFLQYWSPPPKSMSKGWPQAVQILTRPLYDMNKDLALPVHNFPPFRIPNLSSLPKVLYFSSEVILSSMAQQSVHPIINEFLLCPKSNEHFLMQDS